MSADLACDWPEGAGAWSSCLRPPPLALACCFRLLLSSPCRTCIDAFPPHCRPSTAIPEFKVHRDMALDLLMAANYLDM